MQHIRTTNKWSERASERERAHGKQQACSKENRRANKMCADRFARDRSEERCIQNSIVYCTRESVLCVCVIVCINIKNLNPISVELVAMSLSLCVCIDCYFALHRPVSCFGFVFCFLFFSLTCVFVYVLFLYFSWIVFFSSLSCCCCCFFLVTHINETKGLVYKNKSCSLSLSQQWIVLVRTKAQTNVWQYILLFSFCSVINCVFGSMVSACHLIIFAMSVLNRPIHLPIALCFSLPFARKKREFANYLAVLVVIVKQKR